MIKFSRTKFKLGLRNEFDDMVVYEVPNGKKDTIG